MRFLYEELFLPLKPWWGIPADLGCWAHAGFPNKSPDACEAGLHTFRQFHWGRLRYKTVRPADLYSNTSGFLYAGRPPPRHIAEIRRPAPGTAYSCGHSRRPVQAADAKRQYPVRLLLEFWSQTAFLPPRACAVRDQLLIHGGDVVGVKMKQRIQNIAAVCTV